MPTTVRALFRSLRRSPVSAGVAVLTVAVTTAAAAAIFSLIDATLLKSPPFADPDTLVILRETRDVGGAAAAAAVPYAALDRWRQQASTLADLQGYDGTNATLTGFGGAERVSITAVTPGFLPMLGVAAWLGRTFDERDIGERVILVSHAFWRNRLASDRDAVGRSIVLNGEPHLVVGVLPEGFVFALDQSDIWRPLPRLPSPAAQAQYSVVPVARLAPGTTAARLTATLQELDGGAQRGVQIGSRPIETAITDRASRPLLLLGAAASIALLVAFTNFAGLAIVRSLDRHRDSTIRSALGAPRLRIAAQLMVESHLLAAAGLAGGILLAAWATPMVQLMAQRQFGPAAPAAFSLSWQVIGALTLAAWICAVICGAWPAFRFARTSHAESLRYGYVSSAHELWWRRVIVSSQVALAFVLLVALGGVGRSLLRSLATDPGFVADGVMTMQVSVPAATYPGDEPVVRFYTELEQRLVARLGAVAVIDELPLTGDRGRGGIGRQPDGPATDAVLRTISDSYFSVMRIPLLSGRPFDARDRTGANPRVILSRTAAGALFGSQSPIGRTVRIATTAQTAEVIGVVGDVSHRSLDEPPPATVYVSARQAPSRSSVIVVRSRREPADVVDEVRRTVATLDGEMPLYRVRPMREVVEASPGVPTRRLLTTIFLTFAMLALVVGGAGLFALFAHDVTRRRAELAVRAAVGAAPRHIAADTVRRALAVVASGLAAGVLLSWPTIEALHASAMTPDRLDAVVGLSAAALLIAIGVVAVLPAALRASRVDPRYALRPS